MARQFPQAQFVAIVRDIRETAASWQVRADREEDRGWPASSDAPRAVDTWDRHTTKILRAQRLFPGRVHVVEHGRFFGDPGGGALHRILGVLALNADDGVRDAFARAHLDYRGRVAGADRVLPDAVAAKIAAGESADLWRRVQRRAL